MTPGSADDETGDGAGLTLTSSTHGSFFYLIIGAHALHAVVALGALSWVDRCRFSTKHGLSALTRAFDLSEAPSAAGVS